jgi:hypothetical protein
LRIETWSYFSHLYAQKNLIEVLHGLRENEKIFRECIEYSGASLAPADARVFGDILARISQEVCGNNVHIKLSSVYRIHAVACARLLR